MIDVTAINASVNLIDMIGQYTHLRKCGPGEYCGACPKCGGSDRFHCKSDVFFCRQCHNERAWDDAIGFVMWFNNVDFKTAITRLGGRSLNATPEQLAKVAAERARAEAEQLAEEHKHQTEAVKRLQSSQAFEIYHHHPKSYSMWKERGLSETWVRFWRLGYCPSHEFAADGVTFESPTLTIPYWRIDQAHEWQCIGLRHRLLLDDCPGGKYRPEFSGLGNHLFYADPVQIRDRRILIVEGEIKAMVTWASLWDDSCGLDNTELAIDDLAVIGIPGKSWKSEYLAELTEAKRVFICFDPDTFDRPANAKDDWKPSPVKMQEALGDKAKVVRLPGKIDDLLNAGIIDSQFLVDLLR